MRVLNAPEGPVTLSDGTNDSDGWPEDVGPGVLWDSDEASRALECGKDEEEVNSVVSSPVGMVVGGKEVPDVAPGADTGSSGAQG